MRRNCREKGGCSAHPFLDLSMNTGLWELNVGYRNRGCHSQGWSEAYTRTRRSGPWDSAQETTSVEFCQRLRRWLRRRRWGHFSYCTGRCHSRDREDRRNIMKNSSILISTVYAYCYAISFAPSSSVSSCTSFKHPILPILHDQINRLLQPIPLYFSEQPDYVSAHHEQYLVQWYSPFVRDRHLWRLPGQHL